MIKVESCRGCGRSLFIHPIANLVVRLEMEPLDAAQATQALLGGRNLWRVTATSVTGVRPAELTALAQRGATEGPHVCQEHRCTAVSRPDGPPRGKESWTNPKGPEKPAQSHAGPSTPSSARPAASSGARPAGPRRSSPCVACGTLVIIDGPEEYVAAELGATVMWAQHVACKLP